MFDQQVTDALYNILLTIITTGTPIVIGYMVMFIKNHASAKQLQTAKEIALNSVTYAQQISKTLGLDNEAKLNSALASARTLASKYGVKLSDDQWKNLLEPALKEAKIGWNELGKVSLPVVESETTQPSLNDSTSVLEVIETPKDVLDVPNMMMQNTFDQIKAKATKDAEIAIQQVIENVQKQLV